ncbi:Mannan endo-1,6-alpha-mannosidase DCW1 [Neolecta irregularis DAH-3]|uniref:Mannan endo-1,6-alpha-mannosidase n=1 Tax=Neolecta irregularis (strain DAH-3) TaxID=1198029 RepID=A0A1U7LN37_NEOID|nr:Mannan endo-1,6-alpha-mannosidase DCW1 [Neolecta irregularis DAH-3]|eukprot:OLL24064.1 Mannan endo-1,6-alpha-mannosidase DCW1 [Neolecta irregularis DAH-3]
MVCALSALLHSLLLFGYGAAVDVDPSSKESLKRAASTIAAELRSSYHGDEPGQIPGLFPYPTYWWLAGAATNAWIDYRNYTGDTTYDEIVTQAIFHQIGPNRDFLPPNQTLAEGNDDQGFWALAAMSAAERNFPDLPAGQPQWLALAQGALHGQMERWDDENCGGGLRWQIFAFNHGYTYKNSISNGIFFQLNARLARYTKNDTYAQWAEKTFQWMRKIQFMDDTLNIYDGGNLPACAFVKNSTILWSYNNAMLLGGAAFMYDYYNKSPVWLEIIKGLLSKAISSFFYQEAIVNEPACEPYNTCNDDQISFKGYLSRNLGYTAQLVPELSARIFSVLRTSAVAAGKACTGGSGTTCGMNWTLGKFDGHSGVGGTIAALETITSCLAKDASLPSAMNTGATSIGDVNAGRTSSSGHKTKIDPATQNDKVAAAALTLGICVSA